MNESVCFCSARAFQVVSVFPLLFWILAGYTAHCHTFLQSIKVALKVALNSALVGILMSAHFSE
jgi:hypothetical protein